MLLGSRLNGDRVNGYGGNSRNTLTYNVTIVDKLSAVFMRTAVREEVVEENVLLRCMLFDDLIEDIER